MGTFEERCVWYIVIKQLPGAKKYMINMRYYAIYAKLCDIMRFKPNYAILCDLYQIMRYYAIYTKLCDSAFTALNTGPCI